VLALGPSARLKGSLLPWIAPLKLPLIHSTGTAKATAAAAPPATGRRSKRGRGARCLPT
jgi:hypothetical protein